MCVIWKKTLFSTLILGLVFSDYYVYLLQVIRHYLAWYASRTGRLTAARVRRPSRRWSDEISSCSWTVRRRYALAYWRRTSATHCRCPTRHECSPLSSHTPVTDAVRSNDAFWNSVSSKTSRWPRLDGLHRQIWRSYRGGGSVTVAWDLPVPKTQRSNDTKETSKSVLLVIGPKCTLFLVNQGEYAHGTDGRTDGRTDARSLHYAFCWTWPAWKHKRNTGHLNETHWRKNTWTTCVRDVKNVSRCYPRRL